jgi:U3 small nucleolar RNA-associated protein MPP10
MDVDTVTPPELARLTGLVEAKPEAFASGDEDIRIAALAAAKHVFDIGTLYPCHSVYF